MVVEYSNYLHSRGHSVTILTNLVNTIFKIQAKVESFSHNKSKLRTINKALFLKSNSDVIIADIIAMVLFLSFRNKKRLLCFAQDYDESYYKNPLMKFLIRLMYYYCLTIRRIPVIAVSEKLGALLKQRFSADVTIINNGIDTDLFYPDKDKEYLSLKGNRKVILIFARSDFRKGFDLAIKVLKNFKQGMDNGDISVWAVGENIPVPFQINNFGFVSPESLRKILSCSDIFLYPSRHEGLPLFILEAMACGCPIVTTEASNIVEDGFDGLVCPIEDPECLTEKIRQIFRDKDIGDILAKNAHEKVAGFSIHTANLLLENRLKQFIHG